MNFRMMSLVLALLLSSTIGSTIDDKAAKEYVRKLKEDAHYDKNMLPVGSNGPGTSVEVGVSSYIIDIHKVDDSNMDFIANFYFRQLWNDSRLSYSLNVDSLVFNNVDHIWTPDLFFVEEREGSLQQLTTPNIFCRITPQGQVLYSARLKVRFSCPMDLRSYPHDIQKCVINVESYGFLKKQVDLKWHSGRFKPLDFSKKITMLEFDILDAEPTAKDTTVSDKEYSLLQITLTFKRKFGFFAIRLYVPFIILVLMATLSLWIKAEERSLRMALLLVILYLMVTLSTSINELTPSAPYTKATDVWIGFCQSLVFAAFLEFVVVALIAGRESEGDFKGRGEILNLVSETEEGKMKSPLSKVMSMFDARKGEITNSLSLRIDKMCRVLFPVVFVLFNIIYWPVYCCGHL